MNDDLQSRSKRAVDIIHQLRFFTKDMVEPLSVTITKTFGRDPFLVLISCLLSLRARDKATLPICLELFKTIKTPEDLVNVPLNTLYALLYSLGFYRRKAQVLHQVSLDLIQLFSSKVPSSELELLSIKGVGRKTAALVLSEGFGIPAICVDVHVHRISNRLGLVRTKTPAETEQNLKLILPQKYWSEYNHLLVKWGQNICVPVAPFCSKCPIFSKCARVGVIKSR